MNEFINGIGHVAFNVQDLDAALDFYCNKLGFDEMFRLHKEDGALWIVYLRVTDTQYLELFPRVDATEFGNRYAHLCLEVNDIEALVRELEATGVTITAQIKHGLDGNLEAWINDPAGNPIEFMQVGADSKQMQAIARLRDKAL
jgi:lactoylglutathione lyase